MAKPDIFISSLHQIETPGRGSVLADICLAQSEAHASGDDESLQRLAEAESVVLGSEGVDTVT